MSALNVVDRDPVLLTVGLTQPSLADIITLDGSTVDMTGASILFYMRPLLSRTPVINGAAGIPLAPPDVEGHNVQYNWQASDVAVEGNYMGWWGYQLPSSGLIETPEFKIVISDHGPGFGTATGVVVDGISAYMPITVRALRQDPNFGDRFLQQHADYVKRRVMGTTVTADQEVSTYDPMLVEYLSKVTALRLITPAKDFWARQHRQVLTQGPSESATYPDMLANLDVLEKRLRAELPADWRYLTRLIPALPQTHIEPMPMSSLGDPTDPRNGPVTGDPQATSPARTGGPRWNLFMP